MTNITLFYMATKMMKRIMIVLLGIVMMSACSSDDDNQGIVDPVVDEVNVLFIQSDNGKTTKAYMYKSNEDYYPPHCYMGEEIRFNGGNPLTFYHMSFGANIKDSEVFDMLNISFESNQPMSFSDLKVGDAFDSSQFHATAAYTPTWEEYILRQTIALSGKVTVLDKKKIDGKSYIVLRLTNLIFDAIDRSCVYSVNGTVEYEMWVEYEK